MESLWSCMSTVHAWIFCRCCKRASRPSSLGGIYRSFCAVECGCADLEISTLSVHLAIAILGLLRNYANSKAPAWIPRCLCICMFSCWKYLHCIIYLLHKGAHPLCHELNHVCLCLLVECCLYPLLEKLDYVDWLMHCCARDLWECLLQMKFDIYVSVICQFGKTEGIFR